MTVLALSNNADPVLELTPPTLSFTATDGGPNPVPQMLTISNPGKQPLSWSNGGVTSTNSIGPETLWSSNGNWLSILPTSGTVAPGASTQVQALVQSQNLLQNVYSDTLTLTAINALNSPQHVVVSLDVQPGLSTSPTPGGQPTATATTVPPTSTPSSGPRIMDIFGANLSFT